MNTVSSTDAKSNRSGSQQDTDNTLSTRPPQKSASTSQTINSSAYHYSSSSVGLVNDGYFFNEDTSTSSSSFSKPYYHPDLSSYGNEQDDDNDMQQHQPHRHHKLQQQQQRQLNHTQQHQLLHQDHPLQDSMRDVSFQANSLRYQVRQEPPLQTLGFSTLRGQHHSQPQSQTQPPQLPCQDHHLSYEDQHHDQQHQPGGLRFDDLSRTQQQQSHRTYLLPHDQHELFDDDDDDLDDFLLDQEPISSRTQELNDPLVQGSSTGSTFQRPPRPNSSHEVHSNNFITEEEFLMLADDYLLSLSPKKRQKALLSNAMYQKILMVLLQPKNTQVSTAQFRFWVKKMFTLSTTETHHVVCHNGKPVATKECLYDVLVYCHRKSSHGGRDKTSAEVRQHYSWVPKELIARFVKHCPLCSSRRYSLQRSLSGTVLSGTGFELFVPSSGSNDRDEPHHFSASSGHFSGRSSQLNQYSIVEPSQVDHDESIYLNSPQGYRLSQESSSSLTTVVDRDQKQHVLAPTQLQQGARLHAEHMVQLHRQRMQTESALGRYYDDRPPLHSHGHPRSASGSVHDMHGVRWVSRGGGGFTHPDSSGVGPPEDRIEGLQSAFLDRPRRHGGCSGDTRIELDTDQDVEMLGEDSDYGGSVGASKSNSHSGVETLQLRGGHVAAAIEEERDDDCTPSGLVGIPQEVRAPGSGSTGAIRLSSQTAAYNRLYLQQQQQQQQGMGGQTLYPSEHFHQVTDLGSSSSQSMSSTSSTLNQHTGTLSSRASGHSRLVTGYPYEYPYPYSPTGGSNNMVHGPIKQPQLSSQQQRQSMLSRSTSTTFPQISSGPLGAFQEIRDYRVEDEDHLRDQSVHARSESHDGHDQGQWLNPHDL